ncbi:MAG: aminotransferase class I/II-fold pyridoxal phosphate-dependent enzyme [Acidimicrobiia bacterium]
MPSPQIQLSNRGSHLVSHPPMDEYATQHTVRQADVDVSDPGRYIGLAIAENNLVWDLLEARLNQTRGVTADNVVYDDMAGSERFRQAIADFGARHLWNEAIDPSHIVALAGGGTILETLFYAIGDPGDGVLIPTPSYASYWADIQTRDGMRVIPAHMSPSNGFRLETDVLEQAFVTSPAEIRALLLTNPSNPTGQISSGAEIEQCVAWARSKNIHIIMNEVYALSVFGDEPFVSATQLVADPNHDMHFIWAFSKDFAMSGLRAGVLMSRNEQVIAAVRELAYWGAISGDTQHLLTSLIEDDIFVENFLSEMRRRLASAYEKATTALTVADIPFVPGGAGLFVVCDFRNYIVEQTWESEDALWHRFLDEANVNLTPGSSCHIRTPGFMRLCFAAEPGDVVETAIQRIGVLLSRR